MKLTSKKPDITLEELLQMPRSYLVDKDDTLAELIEEFTIKMDSDCEPHYKKGLRILAAYKQDPALVDEIFITLCGWSIRSLLVFRKAIIDEEGILDEEDDDVQMDD